MNVATCSYMEFRDDMGVPVRISAGTPRFTVPGFKADRKIMALTPHRSYLQAAAYIFDERFYGQCAEHGVERFRDDFDRLIVEAGGRTPLVLLCFEKLGKKTQAAVPESRLIDAEAEVCHRRMFAKWWLERTGELIPELGSRVPTILDTPGDPPGLAPLLF